MALGNEISQELHRLVDREMNFMHICGTHEAAIARTGLRSTSGPAEDRDGPWLPGLHHTTGRDRRRPRACRKGLHRGNLWRPAPGSRHARVPRVLRGDVRVVQGAHKAAEIARDSDKEVVFVSVGFETTAPTVAATILSRPPENFSILSCHRLVPPAMRWLLEQGEADLHGFMLPGHVCTVMGYHEYEEFPVPQVVAGFEAEDILLGLLMLAEQVRDGVARVENAYPRAVTREGNVKAQELMYGCSRDRTQNGEDSRSSPSPG